MEIEQILARYGATSFASGWHEGCAVIAFEAKGRRLKFVLPFPDKNSKEITTAPRMRWQGLTAAEKQARYDKELRRRWRCLALAIKAKLEVVESGIATFEEEFMAHIVLPNGATVGQVMTEQIAGAYQSGKMPPLLLGPGGT